MIKENEIIQKTYNSYSDLRIELRLINDKYSRELAKNIYANRNFQVANLSRQARAFLQLSKNLLFICRTEPIPLKKMETLSERIIIAFDKLAKEEKNILANIFSSVKDLFELDGNPLCKNLNDVIHEGKSCLLIHNNKIYQEDVVKELSNLQIDGVLTNSESYSYNKFYDTVIIFGKPEWYKDLVSFPPAKKIICMMYDWDHSSFQIKSVFDEIPSLKGGRPNLYKNKSNKIDATSIENECISKEIDETLDRELIHQKLNDAFTKSGDNQKIDSLLVSLLEYEFAVLIPNTKNYELLVLLRDKSNQDFHLKELPPRSIKNGMWYLDRGYSTDELKEKLSANLFGDKYTSACSNQVRWKELLSGKINRKGLNEVKKELIKRGALNAADYNVKNWASQDVIRPSKDEDLKAILNFLNIEDEFEKIATSAKIIKTCHKKVGFKITEMLVNKIKNKIKKNEIDLDKKSEPVNVYIDDNDKTKMTLYPISSVQSFGSVDRSFTHHVFKYL
jgi:hypothetical protein